MEFEDLDKEVLWEVRRVAVAFEAQEMVRRGKTLSDCSCTFQGRRADGLLVVWTVYYSPVQWFSLEIGTKHRGGCDVWTDSESETTQCFNFDDPVFNEHMMRGLYRLGFEEEDVLKKLNSPLAAHEKMELRLSMPREFWPKTWLEEEG